MSILNKLSDVLKEVFWLKPTSKRKSAARSKSTAKKKIKRVVKKTRTTKPKPVAIVKPLKEVKTSKTLKSAKSPAVSKLKKTVLDPNLVKAGEITHFFDRINVCVVKITHGTILIGDKLTMIGAKTKLVQKVWSMQIESLDVKVAKKGQLIGLKVDKPVVVGDVVYK